MNRAWWLYVLGVAATFLSFPYPPNFLALLAGEIVVILMIWSGLWFGSKHALGSAIPTARQTAYSLLIGAAAGAVVLALLPLAGLQSRLIKEASIPIWKWLIIAADSAVLEEIVFRLFIVSFVVWLLTRFVRRDVAIKIALIVSALLFGAAHLNRWLDAGPVAIIAVMIVNGVIAIILGLVYAKWGIEAAILSHFAGDVILHIVGPQFFV